MNPKIVNSIGLVFDIIGVIILFRFGLPSDVFPNGDIPKVMDGYNEKEKYKKYKRWANCGLAFISIGFLFQLASNWIIE